MSLSRAEIELLLEELAPLVDSASLQRVFEPDERTIVMRLREPGQTHLLLISTETDFTRLHLLDEKPEQPGHPSPFVMLLRKWLHGGWLEAVEQVADDRLVRLRFRVVDPEWEPEDEEAAQTETPPRRSVSLLAELAGRVGNIFLLDEEETVIARQTDEAIGGRTFERGDTWEPPPPPPNREIGSKVRWNLEARDPETYARSRTVRENYRTIRRRRRHDNYFQRLDSRLRDRIKKLERRIEHVEEDLENVEEADKFRRWGELLQQAYGDVEKGDESVRVPDFYEEDLPEVEIPLDPSDSLQENINHYFHQYRRYQDAEETVENRLLESIELRDAAIEAHEELQEREDDDLESLKEFESRLQHEGILERRRQSSGSKKERDRRRKLPYREFEASSGAKILVGKGAEENDALTTKHARGRDLWLHTRDWPGSHVILRLEKDEQPNHQDMVDAATLAAHFSKRRDTLIDITYTKAKHVRKPKGLPPGKVFVGDESTIAVEIDDDRLQRLLDSEVL